MNKTLLVFKHEFMTTIRRTGFIVMTLIVPLIGILGIVIAQIVSGATSTEAEITNVGYVDNIGGFNSYTDHGDIKLVPYTSIVEANKALADSTIKEYFVIGQDYIDNGMVNMFTLEKQLEPPLDIVAAMKKFLTGNLLSGKVPEQSITLVNDPLNVATTRLDINGEISTEQGGLGNLLLPTIFAVLLALSISFSSGYLLAGLGDEKENRLIEVLLSSVSTNQLIIGKVMGLGVAGLIQIVIWVICAPILLNVASISIGGFLSALQISPAFLTLCVVYFILGYLLNAMIMCAIGAISSSTREGQQLAPIFTLLGVCPLWFSSAIILYPDNPAFTVLTIFPFTAPVTLMLRMGASAVPAWEIIVSIVVLIATVIGGLFLTAKVVRTFLLMYGKRPSLGEIARAIRAK